MLRRYKEDDPFQVTVISQAGKSVETVNKDECTHFFFSDINIGGIGSVKDENDGLQEKDVPPSASKINLKIKKLLKELNDSDGANNINDYDATAIQEAMEVDFTEEELKVSKTKSFLLDHRLAVTTMEATITLADCQRDAKNYNELRPYENENEIIFISFEGTEVGLKKKQFLETEKSNSNYLSNVQCYVRCFKCNAIHETFGKFEQHFSQKHSTEYYLENSGRDKDVVCVYVYYDVIVRYEQQPFSPHYVSGNNYSAAQKYLRTEESARLRWYNSACLNALAYTYLCYAKNSGRQREVTVQEMFHLLYGSDEQVLVKHKELREAMCASVDSDIAKDMVWPWTERYGNFAYRSFKVYVILGTGHNFIKMHGNCMYIGFSFQMSLKRIMSRAYKDHEKLADLLNDDFVCCCICALEADSIAKDFDRYRKAVYLAEELVYTWFELQGRKLLNRTLHDGDCGCWTCLILATAINKQLPKVATNIPIPKVNSKNEKIGIPKPPSAFKTSEQLLHDLNTGITEAFSANKGPSKLPQSLVGQLLQLIDISPKPQPTALSKDEESGTKPVLPAVGRNKISPQQTGKPGKIQKKTTAVPTVAVPIDLLKEIYALSKSYVKN